MSKIIIKNAVKKYGNNTVIPDLNATIRDGELFTLLGPSGCGKTTLLRMIAGFNSIEGGDIYFNDTRINDMDPSKRNIGMVFQNYAIFPNMTVRDNVAFGLKNRKIEKEKIKTETDKYLNLMQIMQFAERMPNQLSGGQQQRVALARALVITPDVLLMDEPLSNLDAKLRLEMRSVIRHTQKDVGITTVYVTHDQEECFSISDKVAVMNRGVIEQYDTPEHIYSRPETEFVARFIGFENFLTLHKGGDIYRTDGGEAFSVKTAHGTVPSEETVTGTIRPEDILVDTENRTVNVLTGTVGVRTFLGKSYQYEVNTAAGKFLVNRTADESYEEGQVIRLYLPEEKLILVNGNSK